MARWFGPKDFTTPICRLDAGPGGALYLEMEGPDKMRHPMKATFEEVKPPDRPVFTARAFDDKDGNSNLVHRWQESRDSWE
jgi:uncharacterized protein YndB with AHSA1/START domain